MAQGHRLRSGRFSETGRIYSITIICWQRNSLFSTLPQGRCAVQAMQGTSWQANTLCFVVMPDHVHWLLQLRDDARLSDVVQKMKSLACKRWRRLCGTNRPLWQRGFHDRALRIDDDVVAAARYIIANPLRAGLVRSVRDYSLWDAVWI
ncbi:REP-associated tyrosine transposase [Alloalcanivorax dieselolei]|nr:transposase [Alloalcanivorax dieselolei]